MNEDNQTDVSSQDMSQIKEDFSNLSIESQRVSAEIAKNFQKAFRQIRDDAGDFEEVLKRTIRNISSSLVSQAIKPISNQVSGALGNMFTSMITSEKGNVFTSQRVQAFASGGVVSNRTGSDIIAQPTFFPMLNQKVGLMGEAGAEAIMPLARDAQGRLGVRTDSPTNSPSITINMTIQTPDSDSFHRSRSQISRSLAKAVRQGLT